MSAAAAQALGAVGALGLALLLVATRRDLRVAGLVGWAVGCGGLVAYLAPSGHHRALAAAAVLAAVFAVAGAWIVVRVPWLLALATLACVPARIPVHLGSTQANLLLPLYAVVGVAALAFAWELYGEEPRNRELGPLAWPLALFVGWDGLSFLWTKDVRQGAIELLFFVLPFGLLAVALARLVWSRAWVLTLYVQLALMALIFAVIGIVQYESRDIFWNPKVRVDNAYAPSAWFYRVNSVFYDPSIYGRFLVVGILASLVVVLRRRGDPLWAVAAVLTIGITWVGLLSSFSQSSFVALAAAVVIAAIVVWRERSVFLVAAAVVALVLAGVASPQIRHRIEGRTSLSSITSDRSTLVSNGARLAVHHPIIGVGVGGFRRGYADLQHLRGKEPRAAASHTTPITVAAETGFPGLVLFLLLVAAALHTAFRRLGRGFDGNARLAFGLTLSAILVHCLFYNSLFEDPTFWGLLALVAVGARADLPTVEAEGSLLVYSDPVPQHPSPGPATGMPDPA
ncbi:MAG: O-antigen ligase family protein [Gaiellaceae bacterium]